MVGGGGRYVARHAPPGERCNAVRAHVEPLHVECDRLGQADDTELGGRVIGLPQVADQAGRAGHVHEGTAVLCLEDIRRRATNEKAAIQVHADHGQPLIHAHFVEDGVP